jgi:2-oxo-4-hydroxy-4-carboxy--5-ureidoimidazoline (OHCU) decarboxylase
VRDLPRQLTAEELATLFSERTRFVELLAERERPLEVANEVAKELSEEEKAEALAAHPRIGDASAEQHGDEAEVLAELTELNRAYEDKFGFRFVVFVDRRPRSALVPILRERLGRTREEELATGLQELVAIARDRWIRTT